MFAFTYYNTLGRCQTSEESTKSISLFSLCDLIAQRRKQIHLLCCARVFSVAGLLLVKLISTDLKQADANNCIKGWSSLGASVPLWYNLTMDTQTKGLFVCVTLFMCAFSWSTAINLSSLSRQLNRDGKPFEEHYYSLVLLHFSEHWLTLTVCSDKYYRAVRSLWGNNETELMAIK